MGNLGKIKALKQSYYQETVASDTEEKTNLNHGLNKLLVA